MTREDAGRETRRARRARRRPGRQARPDRHGARHAGILAATLLTAVTAPAAAPSVSAQAVRGSVVDEERGRPLARAAIMLLDDAGAMVDSTRAARDGRFSLTAPAAGVYSVYVHLDGWASVSSEPIRLATGTTTELDLRVPLISVAAMRHMSEVITSEPGLQADLPEICGEPLRPWEAGVLVGTVRDRRSREPVPGARVTILPAANAANATPATPAADAANAAESADRSPFTRSTFANDSGTYILCNVPAGQEVRVRAEAADGRSLDLDVEVRPGTVSWYDLPIR